MRKVITYGTFDLLHAGHINLLRRAKELGDYLIVVVSTDEFNWNEKQKKCYFSYEERKKLVEAVRYVDLVIPEENWDQKISDVKEVESEEKREEEGQEELAEETEEKPEDEKKTATPEELAAIRKEVTELKATVSSLKTQLSKRTGTPAASKTEVKTEKKGESKLSREAVQAAAAAMRKKFNY